MACASLDFPGDGLRPLIASKIIELAKAGETNPDKLYERALIELHRRERLDEAVGSSVNIPAPPGRCSAAAASLDGR
jgi:hypothetical protein